ncbi:high mobility group protein [Salix suchowensis]|nr:high mobility group protein [Salix suchowensis]
MADTAVASKVPKKSRNNRKALNQKNPSTNEANIMAQKLSEQSPASVLSPSDTDPSKENLESLSQPRSSPKKGKSKAAKGKQNKEAAASSFEKDFQEMQEMLQQLKLEKEKTEVLLKEKDEMLKAKDDEIEMKGKEQEKMKTELKKLQKLKEFKPTMTLPFIQVLNEKEQDKKKKKGGNEIKRPCPPYSLWCKDQWNEVKKENPNAEFKDISHILGAKWKTITAEEKKPYEEKYQVEKEAYLKLMTKEKRETEAMKLLEEEHKQKTAMELLEQYLQFKQEADQGENKKNKTKKGSIETKAAMSAFFLFSNERRAVAKIAGEEWKNMTEKQKGPYEKIAKKNKEKYTQEMEAYKQNKDEEAMNLKKEEEELMKFQKQEALQLLKKKEKTENIIKKTKEQRQKKQQQNVDPNKPKKPASSFLLFSKETRQSLVHENPGINSSTLTAMISVKWKELNQEEKQIWNCKAAEAMGAYKKELEEYNKSVAAAT